MECTVKACRIPQEISVIHVGKLHTFTKERGRVKAQRQTQQRVKEMEEKLRIVKRKKVCDKTILHKAPESKSGNESMKNDTGLCPTGSGYFKKINLKLNGS